MHLFDAEAGATPFQEKKPALWHPSGYGYDSIYQVVLEHISN
jgi:hypothetical protein